MTPTDKAVSFLGHPVGLGGLGHWPCSHREPSLAWDIFCMSSPISLSPPLLSTLHCLPSNKGKKPYRILKEIQRSYQNGLLALTVSYPFFCYEKCENSISRMSTVKQFCLGAECYSFSQKCKFQSLCSFPKLY